MLGIGREGLSEFRIKEGKVIQIGGSNDPLDGTWTQADPAWKKLMFIRQGLGIFIMLFLFIPLFIIPAFFIGSEFQILFWVMSPLLIIQIIKQVIP